MAITRAWDEANPQATQFVSTGPGFFQNHQVDIRERMNNGGVVWNNANKDLDGFHAVNAGGGGTPSPDVYKSDLVTKIWGWADAQVTLLAGYQLVGSKNIPEVTVADGVIGIDAKGYKRALDPFRITESAPVDTKVNVKAGVYVKTGSAQIGYYAGGNLTIGAAPLTLPAAGNHASYAIVVDGTGTLTARKGVEAIFANPVNPPNVLSGDHLLGYVDIRSDSVNFSLAAASPNAFLVNDGRMDAVPIGGSSQSLLATSGAPAAVSAIDVLLTKAVTTGGGVVLVLFSGVVTNNNGTWVLGRVGAANGYHSVLNPTVNQTLSMVGIESLAAGAYTFRVTSDIGGGSISQGKIIVIELPNTVLG